MSSDAGETNAGIFGDKPRSDRPAKRRIQKPPVPRHSCALDSSWLHPQVFLVGLFGHDARLLGWGGSAERIGCCTSDRDFITPTPGKGATGVSKRGREAECATFGGENRPYHFYHRSPRIPPDFAEFCRWYAPDRKGAVNRYNVLLRTVSDRCGIPPEWSSGAEGFVFESRRGYLTCGTPNRGVRIPVCVGQCGSKAGRNSVVTGFLFAASEGSHTSNSRGPSYRLRRSTGQAIVTLDGHDLSG